MALQARRRVLVAQMSAADLRANPPGLPGELLALPDPRGGPAQQVLLLGGRVLQLQRVAPRTPGSWFVDQSVQMDGSWLVASKLDARFLLLPALAKGTATLQAALQAAPLDSARLAEVQGVEALARSLCRDAEEDDEEAGGLVLSEDKVRDWLTGKVERAREVLRRQREGREGRGQAPGGGQAPQFQGSIAGFNFGGCRATTQPSGDVLGAKASPAKARADLLLALEMVSEYLEPCWAQDLHRAFQEDLQNLDAEVDAMEAAQEASGVPRGKVRAARAGEQDAEAEADARGAGEAKPAPAKSKPPRLTVGQAKLAKVDKRGMKPLSSFFTKPKKDKKKEGAGPEAAAA